jgi:dihydrofolate reductase
MRKLIVFNNVSLDGYFVDAKGDMSWAHKSDPEWNAFTADNAKGEAQMLFGRTTYELMASYWPTPIALQSMPTVAHAMNNARKVVFSKTLAKATWNNTELVKSDVVAAVRNLKNQPGEGLIIFGSGTIVAQLAPERLIDEYQIVVNPIALGKGKTMFDGVKARLNFKLTRSRTFGNGNVFLCYEHA